MPSRAVMIQPSLSSPGFTGACDESDDQPDEQGSKKRHHVALLLNVSEIITVP
jgi:hypothetical protein